MFEKKPKVVKVDGKDIVLQPKPGFSLFKRKSAEKKGDALQAKPAAPQQGPAEQQESQIQQQPVHPKAETVPQITPISRVTSGPIRTPPLQQSSSKIGRPVYKSGFVSKYVAKTLSAHKELSGVLTSQNVPGTPESFIRRMLFSAVAVALMIAAATIVIFIRLGQTVIISILIGIVLSFVFFRMAFSTFINYPNNKRKKSEKGVEKDILFAARDLIISLRSGMPLYNAMASVSTGYGDASIQFRKIIEQVQLGSPLEDAIDKQISDTKSQSFRRLMIQASVSVRAGADVVASLQTVLDDLQQERMIELRRYGQKLNAIAMFYMLFGVILPSMGIAVGTILTTFISLFQITPQILFSALIGIGFLQIVFLKLITSSRPVFSM